MLGLALLLLPAAGESLAQTINFGLSTSLSSNMVPETSGTVTVTATAEWVDNEGTGEPNVDVFVMSATLGGTATSGGVDFTAPATVALCIGAPTNVNADTASCPANEISASTLATGTSTFELVVLEDAMVEDSETITVTFAAVSAFTGTLNPDPAVLTLTIINTTPPHPTTIDLDLSTNLDAASAPTITVGEDVGTVTVTVTAAFPSNTTPYSAAVEVPFTVSGGTAETPGDFSAAPAALTVTIPAMMASNTETFELTVVNDSESEEAETLVVTPGSRVVRPGGESADIFVFDPTTPLMITITDNDNPQPTTIDLSTNLDATMRTVGEDVGTVTVTVTAAFSSDMLYSPYSTDVEVSFMVAGGTATAGADFNSVPDFTVTIPAMMDSGTDTFELTVEDDSESEEAETLVVTPGAVAIPGDASTTFTLAPTTLTITIDDNDARPVVEALLPELGSIYAASVVDAVSGRVEAVASGDLPRFAGHPSLAHALAANQQSLNDGDLSSLLEGGGSSLAFELGGAGAAGWSGGGQAPLSSQPGFWASADYDHVSSKADGLGDWQGRQYSLHAGVDGEISRNARVGLAVSWAPSSFTFDDDERLDTDASLRGLNPYFGWHSEDGRTVLWTMAGFGTGEFEVDGQDIDTNLQTTMVAAGGSNHLAEESGFDLHIKADVSTIRIRSGTASDTVPAMQARAHRARVAVEAGAVHIYDSGASLSRSVEAGVRIDGGDGDTGSGVEIEGAVDWSNPGTGVTMTGGAHLLFLHSGNLERSLGVSGLIHYAPPNAQGRGLTLQARPSYGGTGSGAGRLWEREATNLESEDDADPKARLVLDAGWGLPALSGRQLVTPYSSLELSEDGSRVWRLGSRATIDSAFSIDLVGDRTERGDSLEHGVGLQLRMQW